MKTNRENALSMGLLLIGIGLIFLLPGIGFWPWILVVVALAGLPSALSRGRDWMAWQGTFWLIGMAILFAFDLFWPGVLLLAGVSVLLGGLTLGKQRADAAFGDTAAEAGDPVDAAWRDLSTGSLTVDEPLFEDSSDSGSGDVNSAPAEDADTAGRDTQRL
ncbi:MAG: hypothetical protein ACYCYF_03015 [Anaerolineae bacterium]